MLRYCLIYGAIAGVVIIAVISLGMFTASEFTANETFGYLIMLVVLSLLFVGVKRYRDVEKGGVIGFLPALGVGLGIAVVAGIFYVVSWEAVVAFSGVDYIGDYVDGAIAAIEAQNLPEAEAAAQIAELEELRATYTNPFYRLPLTFLEIFPVGVVVALVSALLLKNPNVLPAKETARPA